MAEYRRLTVSQVRKDTDDAVCIRFDVPPDLNDTFTFSPGQHLTLRAPVGGEVLERSYSICSGVDDGTLEIGVKKIPGGRFSSFVHSQLAPGATVEVRPPLGRFVAPLDPKAHHRYVALAAGSGITPILSIARSVLSSEPNSQFTLLYGNRSVTSIMFREELEDLKDRYLQRFRLHHFLSGEEVGVELFSRRLDAEAVERLTGLLGDLSTYDAFFICGPTGMIQSTSAKLIELGIPPAKVKVEKFQNPGQPVEDQAVAQTPQRAAGTARVTVKHQGLSRTFDLAPDTPNLLDGAIDAGVDMPFSCKGGVCATCRARVVEGEVELIHNYALEPWELAAGYTLTCQAVPKSDRVVIDYDDA